MCITATDTEFIFFGANYYTGPAFFHDKYVDPFTSFGHICLRHYEVNGSGRAIGDPVFGAIQQVIVAFVLCGGTLRGSIAASLGLTQQEGADIQFPVFTALGERHEVFLFLFFRSISFQSPAYKTVVDTHTY